MNRLAWGKTYLAAVLLSVTALVPAGVTADQSREEVRSPPDTVFARVGDRVVTQRAFDEAYRHALRSRFYHGRPPEGQLDAVRRQVADEVVMRVLLLGEAERLGLHPDDGSIGATLDAYDRRYADSPRYKAHRDELRATLRARLAEEDLLRQIETRVRRVAPPDEKQLVAYYEANPDKFTEPGRQRVSVILLKVDPSSAAAVWDAVLEQAGDLVQRIARGEDFAELARTHSGDASAHRGGDMGYLHQGMLSPAAQDVVDALPLGQVSAPVRLLEGVAVFRVDERRPARLRAFADVAARARELWLRETGERAWTDLRETLRASTPVTVSRLAGEAAAQ